MSIIYNFDHKKVIKTTTGHVLILFNCDENFIRSEGPKATMNTQQKIEYYKKTLANLKKLESLLNFQIIQEHEKSRLIEIHCKYYPHKLTDIFNESNISEFGQKLIELWKDLLENGFVTEDFVFRNIMLDKRYNLHWIDFDSFRKIEKSDIEEAKRRNLLCFIYNDLKGFSEFGGMEIYNRLECITYSTIKKTIEEKRIK